jgi:hypothetical protein
MYCEYTSVRNSYNTILVMIEMFIKGCQKQINGWPSSNFNQAFLSDK